MVYWLASAPCPIHHPISSFPPAAAAGPTTTRPGFLPQPFGPAHWTLGGGSSGSGVLLALLARLPLGLHVALDPIGCRRWPLFSHPPHAEVEEALVPVGLGHFRISEWFYGSKLEFSDSK
jgi:hypothetical protein